MPHCILAIRRGVRNGVRVRAERCGAARQDYCYDPTALHNLGVTGCTPRHKCKICQGDCDKDIDCAIGLKCFQRNGKQQIHGCSKGGKGDTKGYE